jgi:hypothetical protein
MIIQRWGAVRWLLLLTLLGTHPSPPLAAPEDSTRRQEMADAMLKMMDAMGFSGRDGTSRGGLAGPGGGGPQPAPWAGVMDYAPWGDARGGATPWGRAPVEMMRPWSHMPWGPMSSSARGHLDGTWVSLSGERLTVMGERFHLDAGSGRVIEGVLRIDASHLLLYQPRMRQAWRYDYAEQDGRLVLRDDEGQLFLYRRLPAGAR